MVSSPEHVALNEPIHLEPATAPLSLTAARKTWPQGLALAAAAVMHAALIALLVPQTPDALGDDGTTLEAITVSVVTSLPITVAASGAAAAAASSEPAVELEPQAEPEQTSAPSSQPPASEAPPVTLSLPPESEPTSDAPTLPERREETNDVPPREPAEPPVEPPVEPVAPEPQPTAAAEPVPPSAPPSASASSEAAEASAGVVDAYVRRVSRTLAARPPRPAGLKGKLEIRFVIDLDGRPQSAVIERPSGKPRLDDIVLAAIKGLTFPAPDPGMSERQRTFKVPYTFR